VFLVVKNPVSQDKKKPKKDFSLFGFLHIFKVAFATFIA
jgi:hypothetical protein